jgi:hypothetical protein
MDWIDLAKRRDQWRAFVNTTESLGSVKYWEVLEQLHNWRLVKKGSAPVNVTYRKQGTEENIWI